MVGKDGSLAMKCGDSSSFFMENFDLGKKWLNASIEKILTHAMCSASLCVFDMNTPDIEPGNRSQTLTVCITAKLKVCQTKSVPFSPYR